MQNIQKQSEGQKSEEANFLLFFKKIEKIWIFQKKAIGKKVENSKKRKSNIYKVMKKKYNKSVTNR